MPAPSLRGDDRSAGRSPYLIAIPRLDKSQTRSSLRAVQKGLTITIVTITIISTVGTSLTSLK
jgi:hypothetical protein